MATTTKKAPQTKKAPPKPPQTKPAAQKPQVNILEELSKRDDKVIYLDDQGERHDAKVDMVHGGGRLDLTTLINGRPVSIPTVPFADNVEEDTNVWSF